MTSAPNGLKKADAENTDAIVNAAGARDENETLPQAPGPNEPVEKGKVEVTRTAKPREKSDPAGNVTNQRKARVKTPRSDTLDKVDLSKLPISATVGEVVGTIKEYAGNAVLELSLKGWVGDAPFKVLASDAKTIEQVLGELRRELS